MFPAVKQHDHEKRKRSALLKNIEEKPYYNFFQFTISVVIWWEVGQYISVFLRNATTMNVSSDDITK